MSTKKSVINRKKKPTAIIPLILAMIVVFLFYQGTIKKTESIVRPVAVPIAKVKLDEHTEIKEEHIAVIQLPAQGVPPIVETDVQKIIGSYVGTKYTIPQNGYFLKESLSSLDKIPSRISLMLGPNELGITMRMNLEKSVANSLIEGQYVQVRFFSTQTPSRQPIEGILEEKIKILALRDGTGTDVVSTDDQGIRVPTIVVFEASEEQVSYLLRAQNLGELNIVAISEKQYKQEQEEVIDDAENPQNINNEELGENASDPNLVTRDEMTRLLESLEDYLTKDQEDTLKKIQDVVGGEGKGQIYAGNEIKLFIDAMTFRMQDMFSDTGFLVTPSGEIVYYDAETDQMRLFSNQDEYKGSVYALRDMNLEELELLAETGQLSEVQQKVYQDMKLQATEDEFKVNQHGQYYLIDESGEAFFYTKKEVVEQLNSLALKNGSLSDKSQKLLDSLVIELEREKVTGTEGEVN